MLQTVFVIDVDEKTALNKIGWIDEKLAKTAAYIEEVEKSAQRKIKAVIHGAQLAWGVIQGAVRAAGGSISMTTRLIVSAGFGAIQTIIPLLSAIGIIGTATGDPVKIGAAILGAAQMTSAIAALIAFQAQEKQISLQLRGLNFMFSNMSMMLSGLSS